MKKFIGTMRAPCAFKFGTEAYYKAKQNPQMLTVHLVLSEDGRLFKKVENHSAPVASNCNRSKGGKWEEIKISDYSKACGQTNKSIIEGYNAMPATFRGAPRGIK